MTNTFNFRREASEPTEAEIIAAYPPLPATWTAAEDVTLWEGLFRGLKLGEIGAQMGKSLGDMQSRFLSFRHAATGGVGPLTLKAQTVFLQEARRRAGVANG